MSERRPHLWCLFNKASNQLISGLLFDEARAFISNVEAGHIEEWFAWKEEWPDWKPVTEVDGLSEMIFRVMNVAPPPPPRETGEPSIKKVMETDFFPQVKSGFSKSEFILRSQKRFNKRMQVTITGENGEIFESFTRDVSVGGLFLEDSLPDWVAGYFKVRVSKPNSKQQIELTCCLIENQALDERYRVAILPMAKPGDEKNLEHWFSAA